MNKVHIISFILFILFSFPVNNYAQEEVIRVETNLITIPAAVSDRSGRYITNLKKEDFRIFENGIEQEIEFFKPTEEPFTILFLIDVSSSMRQRDGNLDIAINTLASRLRPDDQIMAVTFSQFTDLLVKPTKFGEFAKGVHIKISKQSDRSTHLYNAVDDAFRRIQKIRGRKAIVLFSDGEGGGFGIDAKENLRDDEKSEALVYTVKFGTYSAEPPKYVSRKSYFKRIEEVTSYMQNLAAKAGGRSYQVKNITNITKTFAAIADELSRQYSLGYYPKKAGEKGERRQIKVKVNMPNVVVRARDSYIVGESK